SVLSQSYANLECIIVDDGSTDNSVEIIKSYIEKDNRVKLISKTNGGLPSTRNEGIKKAKGDYLAFLDSDDLWKKDKLTNQIAAFKANPQVGIVFSGSIYFDQNSELSRSNLIKEISFLDLLAGNPIPGCSSSIMLKSEVFSTVGLFDNDLRSAEDQDFLFRCALSGYRFFSVHEHDVLIRKHSESMLANFLKMYYNNMYCFEKNLKLLQVSDKIKADTKKEFKKSIIKRLHSVRWHARSLLRFDLIFYTYYRSFQLAGFLFLTDTIFWDSLFYDLKLYLGKLKRSYLPKENLKKKYI
ncbi:MAG: glycosyltransferase, partial [Bacteroidota bacterium]|nr:glycosyltransferase [Bacteroidota bacterium]